MPTTLAAGASLVGARELKPSQWLAECLAAIDRSEPSVHAWVYLDRELARQKALALDATDWYNWRPAPLLAGLPLGIKDVFNTADLPTQHGSMARALYTPGNDARVVSQAILCGAYSLGKTETAEFAVHAPGRTVNPWHPAHITGTSSSGSAAAVLCGNTPAALGTQSAGSIIRPASYLGVIGYKPTFGLIPRTGVLKTCDTLDTIGWFTRTVADARILLDALRARGRDYPFIEQGIAVALRSQGPAGTRLGYCLPPSSEFQQPYTRDAIAEFAGRLAADGAWEVEEIDLRERLKDAHQVHRTLYHKSLSYYFTRELRHREQISDVFLRITEEGKATPLSVYREALDRQQKLTRIAAEIFQKFDALIMPSVAGEAPPIGVEEPPDASLIWTLCGNPSVSLPLFTGPTGLPFGLQVVAARYADYLLLAIALALFPGEVSVRAQFA